MSFLTVTNPQGNAAAGQQQVDPALVAMFCFEDVIDSGAPDAVASLSQGTWRAKGGSQADAKDVVMLTGKQAEAVGPAGGAQLQRTA